MTTTREELQRQPTQGLISRLVSETDPVMQRRLAFELGRRQETIAVGHLQKLLGSDDARVRAAAVEALGKIGDETAAPDILNLFADETQPAEVRDTCAYALARLQYSPALDQLFRALVDPALSVRRGAVAAIITLGGETVHDRLMAQAELEKDPDLQTQMRSVSRPHPPLRPFLGTTLTSNSPLPGPPELAQPPKQPPLEKNPPMDLDFLSEFEVPFKAPHQAA
jgi:hypothetical protein